MIDTNKKMIEAHGMNPSNVRVVVHVTLEIDAGHWGVDASVAQCVKQGIDSAKESMDKLLKTEQGQGIRMVRCDTARVYCDALKKDNRT